MTTCHPGAVLEELQPVGRGYSSHAAFMKDHTPQERLHTGARGKVWGGRRAETKCYGLTTDPILHTLVLLTERGSSRRDRSETEPEKKRCERKVFLVLLLVLTIHINVK